MEANATLQALLTPQKPTRLPQTSMDNPRLSHLPIHAGPKATVSTKTYVNMLATNLVAALHITGQDVTTARNQILSTADKMEDYLGNWESHVAHIGSLLGDFEELFIIGRGPSMSSVWTGALICKEAAKYAVEGMNAAGFRMGRWN
jgi:glucosamine--fructose-6-phosphate aminotransferase (isomerizing)